MDGSITRGIFLVYLGRLLTFFTFRIGTAGLYIKFTQIT